MRLDSSDKENSHDHENKRTIENEIEGKPLFGTLNIPEYSYFNKDENQSVERSYAKAMVVKDDETKCSLKDLSHEIEPSEVSLKIINQEGRKRKFRVNRRQKMEKLV